jgi:hypothetical protein
VPNKIEVRMEAAREWARKIIRQPGEDAQIETLAEYKMIADWYQSDMRLFHKDSTELNELREFYRAAQKRVLEENSLKQHLGATQGQDLCSHVEEVRSKESQQASYSNSASNSAQRQKVIKRIYIAGPMSDLPEHNFPAFNAAAAWLRGAGYYVINPAELNEVGDGRSRQEIATRDLTGLLLCDAICLLPSWGTSWGAKTELAVAEWAKMEVLYYEGMRKGFFP